MNPNVKIGDLRIRVPGLSKDQARTFASDVANRVSDTIPAQAWSRQLGQVRVRVAVPEGSSQETLKRAVARAIRGALE